MTPAEKAQLRMKYALKAAATADEKIKAQGSKSDGKSYEDQMKFSKAVMDIESSSFVPSSFLSSRGDKSEKETEKKDEFLFGTAAEFKPEMVTKKIPTFDDPRSLADPSLFVDPAEKMDKWLDRLNFLRKKRLEGEAMS